MSKQCSIDPVLFPGYPGILQWMWEYILARFIKVDHSFQLSKDLFLDLDSKVYILCQ